MLGPNTGPAQGSSDGPNTGHAASADRDEVSSREARRILIFMGGSTLNVMGINRIRLWVFPWWAPVTTPRGTA
ncbi:hypothetical protein EMIT0373P_10405 [Pseudomonas chlororaphis]